jgi:DNA-binding HxlR family transcriptional regulator
MLDPTPHKAAIIKALTATPPSKRQFNWMKRTAREVGVSHDHLRKLLSRLEQQGHVVKPGDSWRSAWAVVDGERVG